MGVRPVAPSTATSDSEGSTSGDDGGRLKVRSTVVQVRTAW